jgi:hypothetical protein
VKNVWLSNLDYQTNKIKRLNEAAHTAPDDDEEEMPEDDEEEPEDKLTDRQKIKLFVRIYLVTKSKS